MVLFVNGCVRTNSRTLDLAKAVLEQKCGELQCVNLCSCDLEPLNEERLLLRDALIAKKDFSHPMLRWAVQFAQADTIVIAAPYWDLLFPTMVRAYLEAITVSGITFFYNEQGIPQGLCKAKKLIYVTTSGGPIIQNFGFEYIKALATTFYGIETLEFVSAEGLDIFGADPDAILRKSKSEYLSK